MAPSVTHDEILALLVLKDRKILTLEAAVEEKDKQLEDLIATNNEIVKAKDALAAELAEFRKSIRKSMELPTHGVGGSGETFLDAAFHRQDFTVTREESAKFNITPGRAFRHEEFKPGDRVRIAPYSTLKSELSGETMTVESVYETALVCKSMLGLATFPKDQIVKVDEPQRVS